MKKIVEKIEPIAGYISIASGIVCIIGWAGSFFSLPVPAIIFQILIPILGIVFGCIGYGCDNSNISFIGTIMCFALVAFTCIAFILSNGQITRVLWSFYRIE